MKVFKNRDARFPICIELNDGSIQKLTFLAAKELSDELLKNLGEASEPVVGCCATLIISDMSSARCRTK